MRYPKQRVSTGHTWTSKGLSTLDTFWGTGSCLALVFLFLLELLLSLEGGSQAFGNWSACHGGFP